MSRWITAGMVFALLGCAGGGTTWERPGTSDEKRAADQDDCMSKATVMNDPGGLDPNTRARVQRDYEDCMQRKGYRLTVPVED